MLYLDLLFLENIAKKVKNMTVKRGVLLINPLESISLKGQYPETCMTV